MIKDGTINLISLLTPSGIVLFNIFFIIFFIVQKLMFPYCLGHERLNSTWTLELSVKSLLLPFPIRYIPSVARETIHTFLHMSYLCSSVLVACNFSLVHPFKDSLKAFHGGGFVLGTSIPFIVSRKRI